MKTYIRYVLISVSVATILALSFTSIFVYWLKLTGASVGGENVEILYGLYWAKIVGTSNSTSKSLQKWSNEICSISQSGCSASKQNYKVSDSVIALIALIIALSISSFTLFWLEGGTRIAQIVLNSVLIVTALVILILYGLGIDRNFQGNFLDWSAGWWIMIALMAVILWSSSVLIIYYSVGNWGRKKIYKRVE